MRWPLEKKRRLSFLLKKAEAVVGHNLFGANWKNKKCVCCWLCLSGLSTQSTATQPDLFIYSFSHVYSSVMKSLLLPQTSWVALYRDTAWSFSKWVQTAPATKLCECECVCVCVEQFMLCIALLPAIFYRYEIFIMLFCVFVSVLASPASTNTSLISTSFWINSIQIGN